MNNQYRINLKWRYTSYTTFSKQSTFILTENQKDRTFLFERDQNINIFEHDD